MKEIEFSDIKLRKTMIISRQILLYFFDFYKVILPIFDKANVYRLPFKAYDRFREKDKIKFSREMYRLKRLGFIKEYFKNKEKSIELTAKGKKYLKRYLAGELIIKKPAIWDKKWRLVIFDIPNDKKAERDVIRRKLERLGFLKLQESVYVFPFECLNEINLIKGLYFLSPYIQYIVAERVETEMNLLKEFYDRGILGEEI